MATPPLSQLLRLWRDRALLTQDQLSDRSGVSARTIRRIESASLRPRSATVDALAAALDLNEEERCALREAVTMEQSLAAAAPDGSVTPRQLPAAPAVFLGRESVFDHIRGHILAAGRTPVCIDGPGGVGKSALGIYAARSVADHFAEGQLYVDLQGQRVDAAPLDPIEVIARFLRSFATPPDRVPTTLDEAAAMYRSFLASRAVLIVLDNAADASQVRPLLPASDSCAVLVTSRSPLASLDLHRVSLEPLGRKASRELVTRWAGPARVRGNTAAVDAIVDHCGGIPLALRIVGAHLMADVSLPLPALAEDLADEHRRLDRLRVDDVGVRASFQASYAFLARLAPTAAVPLARFFRLLGLPCVPALNVPAVAALWEVETHQAAAILNDLAVARLVERDLGYHRMHDLLRLFAAEIAATEESAQDRRDALRRIFGFYLNAARDASDLIRPGQQRPGDEDLADVTHRPWLTFDSPMAATDWLDAERANLLALARQSAREEEPLCRLALRLPSALRMFLPLRGYMLDWIELSKLSLHVARRLADRTAEGIALMDLGAAAQRLNRTEEAFDYLHEALAVTTDIGLERTQAGIHAYLGATYAAVGAADQAIAAYEQALTLRRRIGHDGSTAITLSNAAQNCLALRQFDAASRYIDESLAVSARCGDRHNEGFSLVLQAALWTARRDYHAARGTTDRGLILCRQYADRHNEAAALTIRSIICQHTGDIRQAIADARLARHLYRQAGDTNGQELAREQEMASCRSPSEPHQRPRQGSASTAWLLAVVELSTEPVLGDATPGKSNGVSGPTHRA